jgi:chemotaxis protein methyltransferase CheR
VIRDPLGDSAHDVVELDRLRSWLRHAVGIEISQAKRPLLLSRLGPRTLALALPSVGAYIRHALSDPEETQRMVDSVVTNETSFFRAPEHFAVLERTALPALRQNAASGRRARHVRAWSAACATGEEAYSLAMCLLTHLPAAEGWTHEIVGSDISTRALALAEEGVYPLDRLPPVSLAYRKLFLLRGFGVDEGRIRVRDELRRAVRFTQINLCAPPYALTGVFDLIFCRNVLIYFSAEMRPVVVSALLDRLAPGGLIFMGHAESLHGHRARVHPVAPNVYAFAAEHGDRA